MQDRQAPDLAGRPAQAKVQAVAFSPCEEFLASVGALSCCAASSLHFSHRLALSLTGPVLQGARTTMRW